MSRFVKYLHELSLKRKTAYSMIILLIFTLSISLVICTVISYQVIKDKSVRLSLQQMETAGHNTGNALSSVNDVAGEILGNSYIQSFLRAKSGRSDTGVSYTVLERSAGEVLDNQYNSSSILQFITLKIYRSNQLMYSGGTWTIANLPDELDRLYLQSEPLGGGTLRYCLDENVFDTDSYACYFFMPVYNLYRLNEEMGLLTFCVPEDSLRVIYSSPGDNALTMYLTNEDGLVLSCADKERILSINSLPDIGPEKNGFRESADNRKLLFYQALPVFNWYIMGEIPMSDLLHDFPRLCAAFLLILFFGTTLGIVLSNIISKTIYRPIKALMNKMEQVSQGDLNVHIPEESYGSDLKTLISGFNIMVRQVNGLMEQVKEEQRQAHKIELNMLQSQIQPHFLYNMLDSIHWQAAYNKDKEASEMLQTLANYYRRSISKGNDIIPLKEELAIVTDYLKLQNMRYDNLVDLTLDIPEHWYDLPIPKLTLQPLVENSIYHGFRTDGMKRGRLIIRAEAEGEDVIITVEDDGKGMSSDEAQRLNDSLRSYDDSAGYGLRNVHKRFEIYFGSKYGLYLQSNGQGGTTVAVRLPGGRIPYVQFIDR